MKSYQPIATLKFKPNSKPKSSLTNSYLNATIRSSVSKKLTRQNKNMEKARPESKAQRKLAVLTAQGLPVKKVKIFSDRAESDLSRSKSRENKRYESS